MKAEFIKDLFAKFEEVASVVDGVECWSARDIYPLFGYTQWRGFQEAINRAKESCKMPPAMFCPILRTSAKL